MRVFGLVGGIASGKSTVAAELATLGAKVLDADADARDAINLPNIKQQLVERWGPAVLKPSGDVDRRLVAERVFGDSPGAQTELKYLESLLHPVVREQFEQALASCAEQGVEVVVIDAPLLLEAGWQDLCEALILVESTPQDRSKRIAARRWTESELQRREAAQMPLEEKHRHATYRLLNRGSLEDLRQAVQKLWEELTAEDGSP